MDLYTSAMRGHDSDEMERWIERDFETPAQEPLERLIHGEELDSVEWEKIGRYAALQDVRTPADYLEFRARWERDLPLLIDQTLNGSVKELEDIVARGEPLPIGREVPAGVFDERFPFPVVVESRATETGGELGAEVTVGRAMWLASIAVRLTSSVRVLSQHKWTVLRPSPGCEWFTTDRPLMRLNYYGAGKFDFGGGWGNPGSELVMPLSPQHLLYTKVGDVGPPVVALTQKQTFEMQTLLAKNAHRWVFARTELKRVAWLRPRVVNEEMFRHEKRQWQDWHSDQSAAEKEIFSQRRRSLDRNTNNDSEDVRDIRAEEP